MRSHHLRPSLLVALVAAFGASACSDSTGVDSNGPVVPTVTPLVYDATCAAKRPSRRITSGELHADLMVDGVLLGALSIVWIGCDMAPTGQFTPV